MRDRTQDREGHAQFPLPEKNEWMRDRAMQHLDSALTTMKGAIWQMQEEYDRGAYSMDSLGLRYPTPYTDMVARFENLLRSHYNSAMVSVNTATSVAASLDQAIEDHRAKAGWGKASSIAIAAQRLVTGPKSGQHYQQNMDRLREALQEEAK